jgi:hypothetical protein
MSAHVLPIAATDTWVAVVERAGGRCQCTTCPSRTHKGRCTNEDWPGARLLAGPASPGPDPARTIAAARPDNLVAWCPKCWDRAVKAAREHAQAEQAPAEGLF